MPWNVEYTDEFGEWWRTLSEGEQDDVAAIVTLLERSGPQLPFPTRRASKVRATRTCASYACRAAAIRCGCSTLSIRAGARSCWSRETREAIGFSISA